MGVTIHARNEDFFSFFNSPYYSHINCSAIDIYPNTENPIIPALSPVDGIVSRLYEFKPPRPRHFEASETEKLMLIIPNENHKIYVRILHIDSQIQVGTRVSVGDQVGILLRSGFFNFWTGKHIHVEVRCLEEPLRAKGGYVLEPINKDYNILSQRTNDIPPLSISAINEDYALADVENGLSRIGNFWGLECRIGSTFGILDGGIPHYQHGGIHAIDTASVRVGDAVWLWGTEIGRVVQVSKNLIHFKSTQLSISVNGKKIRGLSLHPWLSKAKVIRIIPEYPRGLQDLKKGEKIHLSIA
ncbi:MAG: hypothetical protein QG670_1052 [Thermoproteota archaeon]|nr:hypothetical protein [Thermoproteota archaeon]